MFSMRQKSRSMVTRVILNTNIKVRLFSYFSNFFPAHIFEKKRQCNNFSPTYSLQSLYYSICDKNPSLSLVRLYATLLSNFGLISFSYTIFAFSELFAFPLIRNSFSERKKIAEKHSCKNGKVVNSFFFP